MTQRQDDKVYVYPGQSSGFFRDPKILDLGSSQIETSCTADLNKDGMPDLVIGLIGSTSVLMFLADGLGGFHDPTSLQFTSLSSAVEKISVADMNGDGNQDLLLSALRLHILLGNGDGTFQESITTTIGSPSEYSVVSDFNNDGKIDFFYGSGYTQLVLGNGDGTLETHEAPVTSMAWIAGMETGDYDHDGNQDVAVVNMPSTGSPRELTILLGNGDGTFTVDSSYPLVGEALGLASEDFNRDGHLDFVCDRHISSDSDGIQVFLGEGDGTFEELPPLPISYTWHIHTTVGDLDGDGILDLIWTGYQNTAPVLFGNGDGTFMTEPRSIPSRDKATRLATGDFNNDGMSDIVSIAKKSSDTTTPGLSITFAQSDGAYSPATELVVGPSPREMEVVDINRDDNLDILWIDSEEDTFSVLLGAGDGTFTMALKEAVPEYPIDFACADLNEDPWLDVAILSINGHRMTIYFGAENELFEPETLFAPISYPKALAAGDLNGDAHTDLVLSSEWSTVRILLGDGQGGFTYSTIPADLASGEDIELTDFNGDGNLDILIVSAVSIAPSPLGLITVLLGNGNGTFQPGTNYSAEGGWASRASVGDLNEDEIPDVFLTLQGGSARFYAGNADGTLEPPSSLWVDLPGSTAATLLDFDDDGDLDVFVPLEKENSMALIENNIIQRAGPVPIGWMAK
ncbi:VCBS repeat-containing protein [bacterium]|nr:VCBS repeat-containing protein [bacterium]